MGASIARRLVASHRIVVDDLRPEALAALVEEGAEAATPELLAQCRLVFVCLPAPDDVRALLDKLLLVLGAGSVVVDMTTGSPAADVELRDLAARGGVTLVDAPVSGGPQGAEAGTLTIMVGADPEVFAAVGPYLDSISSNVHHVGGAGTGHAMKLVCNLLSACNRVASLEAVELARRSGIPQAKAIEILNVSGGRSYITERTYPMFLTESGYTPQHFSVGLLAKDVRLAQDWAAHCDLDLTSGKAARALLDQAETRFGSSADINQMMSGWFTAE
jgi:3-hydroxyisobutyrate dehydrogenase-like beta-hydroxyacid dehydrogenase